MYYSVNQSTVLLFHLGLMALAVSWGWSQHGHWHRDIERELFNSSWDNPHLAHIKILRPENIVRIGCFAPWGRGAQPGGPCERTDGHTDGSPYLCRSSDRYSYTGATLFRQHMLIQNNKINTSGCFTQDDLMSCWTATIFMLEALDRHFVRMIHFRITY